MISRSIRSTALTLSLIAASAAHGSGPDLDEKGYGDLCKARFDAFVQAVLLGDARGEHAQRVLRTSGQERRTRLLARAVRSPPFKRQNGIPVTKVSHREPGHVLEGWGYGALDRKEFIATVVPPLLKTDDEEVLERWENRLAYWNRHIRQILGVPPGTPLGPIFQRMRDECPEGEAPRLIGPRTRLLAELVRSKRFQKRHASEIRSVVRETPCQE
jgi:hypothetical protein